MNTELMNQIAATPGRLDKEALLAKVEDPRWLKWALDPAVTFRVTVDEDEAYGSWLNETVTHSSSIQFWISLEALCQNLSTRELTGNAALTAMKDLLDSAPSQDHLRWACRVINKDLRCNFGVSTVEKVFPGLIEPFACMLAHPYDPDKHSLGGSWIAQAKLDGLRMVVVDGVAYTRTGKILESVGHILDQLSCCPDVVFDGEVMGEGGFDAASGKTRKKGNGPDTSLVYHVFDAIPIEQWRAKKTQDLEDRADLLLDCFCNYLDKQPNLRFLPWRHLPDNPTFETIASLRDGFIADGYEGVMLKNLAAPYCFKRTNDLLKYKFMYDADVKIVECLPGKGKHKGKLGAWMVDNNGVQSKVGSGFSDAQRAEFWDNRDAMIGATVEVAYQGLTEDGKFRFPIFIRTRPDKDV